MHFRSFQKYVIPFHVAGALDHRHAELCTPMKAYRKIMHNLDAARSHASRRTECVNELLPERRIDVDRLSNGHLHSALFTPISQPVPTEHINFFWLNVDVHSFGLLLLLPIDTQSVCGLLEFRNVLFFLRVHSWINHSFDSMSRV